MASEFAPQKVPDKGPELQHIIATMWRTTKRRVVSLAAWYSKENRAGCGCCEGSSVRNPVLFLIETNFTAEIAENAERTVVARASPPVEIHGQDAKLALISNRPFSK